MLVSHGQIMPRCFAVGAQRVAATRLLLLLLLCVQPFLQPIAGPTTRFHNTRLSLHFPLPLRLLHFQHSVVT